MRTYLTEKIYVGRTIQDKNQLEDYEKIICIQGTDILVSNGTFVILPISHGLLCTYEDENSVYMDLNIVLYFLQCNGISLDFDKNQMKYSIFYVCEIFTFYDFHNSIHFYECILDNQSSKRFEDFIKVYNKFDKKVCKEIVSR
jgi:hypothetical protein